MTLHAIEKLLQATMGLNAASIGSTPIERAIRQRMESLSLTDIEDYHRQLLARDAELKELIELVVVPETWFFRDMNPFTALTTVLTREWLPKNPTRQLRILSVPCSTGEEPYTITMALDQAGLTKDRVHIDAVDISERNIVYAERAQYGNNSFRGDNIDFRDRYFQKTAHGYHLRTEIRDWVRFAQGNILDEAFHRSRARYDVIFCRNLLIYFDRETQARAIDALTSLLYNDGYLFLGHAEAGVLKGRGFESLPFNRSFGFRPGREPATPTPAPRPARRKSIRPRPRMVELQPALASVFPTPEPAPAPEPVSEPVVAETGEDWAERLANEGHLVEAAEICENRLRTQGPNARDYYLLGLVREATGEGEEAEDFLRKAIYLDPDHVEAMTHLALILERQGASAEAERLRNRAERRNRKKGADA